MPAVSKAQQKLFGIVHAVQTGRAKGDKFGPEVRKLARTMSSGDVKKYATTKIKDLPNKIRQMLEAPEVEETGIGGVPVTDTPPASSKQPHISNDPKLVTFDEDSTRDQLMATKVRWKDEDGKEHEATVKSIYGSSDRYPKGSPARRAADQVYARHKNPKPAAQSARTSTVPTKRPWPVGGDDRTWFDKYSSRSRWESTTSEQTQEMVEDYSQKQSKIFSVLKDRKPSEIDGVTIDMYTAALLTKVLKKLSSENRGKMLKLPMEKMVATAYKLVTR